MRVDKSAVDECFTEAKRANWLIRVTLRWSPEGGCFGGYADVYRSDAYQFKVCLSKHFTDEGEAEHSLVQKAEFWIAQWKTLRPLGY